MLNADLLNQLLCAKLWVKAFLSEEYKLHIILLKDVDPSQEVQWDVMRGCGLTSLLVCINVKTCEIREQKCDNKE